MLPSIPFFSPIYFESQFKPNWNLLNCMAPDFQYDKSPEHLRFFLLYDITMERRTSCSSKYKAAKFYQFSVIF